MRMTAHPDAVHLWGFQSRDKQLHLFAANLKQTYHWADVVLNGAYEFHEMLSGGFVLPPALIYENGVTHLRAKIPPMGTVSMVLRKQQEK